MKKAMQASALVGIVALCGANTAQPSPAAKIVPAEVVAKAPRAAWRAIDPADLLVMELEPDRDGQPRRVIIQLLPPPASAPWVQNVRTLAREGWWNGLRVVRAQDNYVVQWGSARADRALPGRLLKTRQSEYTVPLSALLRHGARPGKPDLALQPPLTRGDAYARMTFIHGGWPYASDGTNAWPVHCYAMVGAGREMTPDAGSGIELYTVIGHAPRHLDRNVPLIGRIVEGIEHLSVLPRGQGDLGFYTPSQPMPEIRSVKFGSDLPASEQPRFEYLSSASAAFREYAFAKTSRRDDFFSYQPGSADICNIPVPVRRAAD